MRVKSALGTTLFDDKCKEHDEASSKFVVPYAVSRSVLSREVWASKQNPRMECDIILRPSRKKNLTYFFI